MLTVKELSLKINGKKILAVPEFTVRRGEFTAVIGPNGAGKTSLLRALGTISDARCQEYILDGVPRRMPEDRLALTRMYSHVFQAPMLLSGTVIENVCLPLRLRGISRKQARERALHWLTITQSEALATRQAQTLSGGETARVILARAMVSEPRLVFLDEPFTYLDVEARAYLLRHLRRWLALTDTTGVMVSHDYSEVALLADRLVVMDKGAIVEDGDPEAILAAPTLPFLCDFVTLGRATWHNTVPPLAR